MKTLFVKFISCGLISILAFSCEKVEIKNELEGKLETFVLPDGHVLMKNPNNIIDFINNEEPLDDIKISRQRYELGLIIRDLFVDGRYNKILIDNALANQNDAVCLQTFVNEIELLKTNEEPEKIIKLKSMLNSLDFTRQSSNPLKQGHIEEYIPALFLINAETAEFDKQPFISPGIEVNAELPGLEKFDDCIVAWIADGKGDYYEVLIDEEFALGTKHPIFSVDNAEYELTHKPKQDISYNESESLVKNQQTARYSTYEYRINHRFESNSESEFTITAARIDQNGVVHWTLRNSDGTGTLYKKIADVKKDYINKDLYKWTQFCNEAPIPFNENFIFFNTYERDWWGSDKSLGKAERNGVKIYLSGRRTYSGDWYAYDPAALNENPVDIDKVYWSWAEWHLNDRGHLRFWRIQP